MVNAIHARYNYSLILARISLSLKSWYSWMSAGSRAAQRRARASCAVPAEEGREHEGSGLPHTLSPRPLQSLFPSPAPHTPLTSSPTLIGEPPQLGRRTRSPSLTEQGTTLPSWVAPGPTAMTVASGRGDWVAVEGRKMPVAVFCSG